MADDIGGGDATVEPEGTSGGPAPADPVFEGAVLGRYRIGRLLGRGGMGEVYEAFDLRLERRVALKRLAAGRRADATARARFWREARVLAALKHPGIVAVHDVDELGADLCIVMELVDGANLERRLGAPLPLGEALRVAKAAAEALGAAHAAGVVHRDVKPGNVLLGADGVVRVADFGLALRPAHVGDEVSTGARPGTPGYMAPEQLEGRPVDARCDVFALGVVLYRMVTGVHPFERETAAATSHAIAGAVYRPLSGVPGVPTAVAAVVERCLALAPEARYPSGSELAAALGEALGAIGDAEALGRTVPVGPVGPRSVPAMEATGEGRLASVAPVVRPARHTRRVWVWAALALGVGVVVVVVLFWANRGDEARGGPGVLQAGAAAATVTAPSVAATPDAAEAPIIPPRPVVGVLELAPARPELADAARVCAEVLRIRLDEDPEHIVLVGAEVMGAAPGVDLIVRGRYEEAGGREAAALELVTPAGRLVAQLDVAGGSPIALGEALAARLAERLGGDPKVARARLTTRPEALLAYLDAKAARATANDAAVTAALDRALALDPGFGLARGMRIYRQKGRSMYPALAAEARALLAEEGALPARERAWVEAMLAYLDGDSEGALRAFQRVGERWPYDLDSRYHVLMLRFHDVALRSFDEVERVARELLRIAPGDLHGLSRLMRVLAWRGRGDEAEALFEAVKAARAAGLAPGAEDQALATHAAELDLYLGRAAAAAAGFRAVVAREPGQAYAEHMGMMAEIIAGRCDEAAERAMDRVERVSTLEPGTSLDWTYGVAALALACGERWAALDKLSERWREHSPSSRSTELMSRPSFMVARGEAAAVPGFVDEVLQRADTPADARPRLVLHLARVDTDQARLRRFVAEAEAASFDIERPAAERSRWRHTLGLLRARLALLEGKPTGEVMAAFDEAVVEPAEVGSEEELAFRLLTLVARAEAMEALGLDARARWREIAGLGYTCLSGVHHCREAARRAAL